MDISCESLLQVNKMALTKVVIGFALMAMATATPASKSTFWQGSIEEMRSMCANDDPIACIKYKFLSFLDNLVNKDFVQLTDSVEISRNSYRSNEVSGRSDSDFKQNIQQYLQSHDVTFKLPLDSTVTVGGRNLQEDELDFKFRFSTNQPEARKSKLKKIIVPILVFVLLKAITLIPLALGILGLKAWNALQLSFFSFVISVALAVFQLCKKIASDGAHPQIAAHGPWDAAYSAQYARSFSNSENYDAGENAQKIAYSAYV